MECCSSYKKQHSISNALFLYQHIKTTLFIVQCCFGIQRCRKYFFWEYRRMCIVHPHSPTSIQRYRQLADRGWLLDLNSTSHISHIIRQLVSHSFSSFWTTLHKYVPYRSVRWCCVALCPPAQNLWCNLCTIGTYLSFLLYFLNENWFSKIINFHILYFRKWSWAREGGCNVAK